MIPTLSFGISDIKPADARNLVGPTPECPMGFRLGGGSEAGDGLTRGSFPRHRANHDGQQHFSAALPRGRRRGSGRGEFR
jgi:hypothetical protein